MVNKIVKIPAPTGGYNNRDNITDMNPIYASIMENMIPRARSIISRKGYMHYADTLDGKDVETIMSFNGQTNHIFAATQNNIYDITTAPSTLSIGGQTNGRWSSVMFGAGGGSRLVIVNGFDKPLIYDGSSWINPSFATTAVPPVDQTVLSQTFFQVVVYMKRLFFIPKNSLSFYYLGVNSIAGELFQFDLTSVFSRGGYIVGSGTWSRDGGSGMTDLIAFFTNNGEVAVYNGTDITDVNSWNLQGLFQIGDIAAFWHDPVVKDGRNASRSIVKIGSDLNVITSYGVVPLSQILPVATGAAPTKAITDTVIEEFNASFQTNADQFGWQILEFPFEGLVIVNIPEDNPESDAKTAFQLVMNQTNGAWCKFTNIDALCFHSFQQRLFFGAHGGVIFEANKGYNDNTKPMTWTLLTSYQDYNIFEKKKGVRVKPYMFVQENVLAYLAAEWDYRNANHFYTTEIDGNLPPLWDSAQWDVNTWFDSDTLFDTTRSLKDKGTALAIYMRGQTENTPVQILRFDVAFEVQEQGELV